MRERTLLERIEALEAVKEDAEEVNPIEVEIRSIMNHLRKLLNTDKGSVNIDLEYGMPDMTVYSSAGLSETMERIEKSVLEAVQKYEKRLTNVKVMIETSTTEVLNIHFRLHGELVRYQNMSIMLDTSVKPGGKVNISRMEL